MINNVVLVGRLTRDPDLRYTSNGVATANFNLAVNRNFTNQNGDREADFINCVIWRKSAENLANFTKKGTLIGVVGRIQTRSYDNQQGQKVYVTEVVCDNFQLLEKKPDGARQNQSNSQPQQTADSVATDFINRQPAAFGQSSLPGVDALADSSAIDINDDDLPF